MSLGRVSFGKQYGRITYNGVPVSYDDANPQQPQANAWSSTENNSNNAWNVNFNDGNTNNNNKYNSNVVRPCVAYSEPENWDETVAYSRYCNCQVPADFLTSVYEAYYDCRKGKMSSKQCIEYMNVAMIDIPILAYELWTDTYHPITSTCFLVRYPKWREVFAANFRDRIVHHWLCRYINPLFEQLFIEQGNVSFNCRKGYGTIKATDAVYEGIRQVTDNYRRKAWVFRGDLVGFFMSIDKNIMWQKMQDFIVERYNGPFKDIVMRVARIIIYHQPEKNCILNSEAILWKNLTANKSLLRTPDNKGMPIGNLTTQLFANFYMSFFDSFILRTFEGENFRYARFVDDFVIIHENKQAIVDRLPAIERYLSEELHLRMHKNKRYMQPASHGLLFVGTYMKNGRTYLSNRTLARMQERIHGFIELMNRMELSTLDCQRIQSVLNSYLGFCKGKRTYRKRVSLLRQFGSEFFKYFYIEGHYEKVKVRQQYKPYRLCV